MAITGGFSFNPGVAARSMGATPTPLQFVDGRTLAVNSGLDVLNQGALAVLSNELAAAKSVPDISGLLDGIKVGVNGLVSGIEKRGDLDLAEKKIAADAADRMLSRQDAMDKLAYDRNQALEKQAYDRGRDAISDQATQMEIAKKQAEIEAMTPLPVADPVDALYNSTPDPSQAEQPLSGLSPLNVGRLDTVSSLVPKPLGDVFLANPSVATRPQTPLEDILSRKSEAQAMAETGSDIIPDAPAPKQQSASQFIRVPVQGGGTVVLDRFTRKIVPSSQVDEPPQQTTIPEGMQVTSAMTGPDGVLKSVRYKATAASDPTAPSLTSDQLKVVNTIGDNYRLDEYVKAAADAQRSVGIVKEALTQDNGFGDIAAINAFQRMIDPGVAVREGDVALLQSAIAKFDQLNPAFLLKKLQSGDKLDAGTRKKMLELATNMADIRARAANEISIPRYKNMAEKAGISFDLIGQPFATMSSRDSNAPVVVRTQEEYDKLKKGDKYQGPNGELLIKN